jgi:hypothetical protein
MKTTGTIMSTVPLPDVRLDKPRYVAVIRYQLPKRIILSGRRKVSPRYETFYGMLYWLNKQPYNMDYIVYRTDSDVVIMEGFKRKEETLK